ncbi:hypothetical protein G6011_00857 [Alternaria panax]|uniref:Uncharacterized protein n=1 Tax=Alternaria panax TaxID=48097 RepID=A0AAD4IJX6_9PLEO|nr:hypothetical protein G6011_00857 [Alternaria panax]
MATAASSSSFRFRDLPEEIRKKIYRVVLCSIRPPPTTIPLDAPSFFDEMPAEHEIETAILRTSKEIYREAYNVMVKSNRFVKVTSSRGLALRGAAKGRAVRMIAIEETVVDRFTGYVLSVHIGNTIPWKIPTTHDPDYDSHGLCEPVTAMILHSDL